LFYFVEFINVEEEVQKIVEDRIMKRYAPVTKEEAEFLNRYAPLIERKGRSAITLH